MEISHRSEGILCLSFIKIKEGKDSEAWIFNNRCAVTNLKVIENMLWY